MMKHLTPALVLSLAASSTFATTPAETLIQTLGGNQVQVEKTFNSIGNLQGFVIKPKGGAGQPNIVYVDKDGRYAFVGALLDAKGSNQSEADTQKYVNSTLATNALADSANTSWILDGKADAKHLMYVVADPNCTYCNKLYQDTRSYINSGDLAIRWIWVGFLKQSSPGIAQAILASDNPTKAMAENEKGFNANKEEGGLKPLQKPSKTVTDKFAKNMEFMNKYQFPGTPVVIYKDKSGKAQSSFGMPQGAQFKTMLDNMGTL